MHEDNQSTIKIANNPEFHGRTKHMDLKFHFLKEHVESKQFTVKYCCTSNMVADIFTKALKKPQFQKLRRLIGIMNASEDWSSQAKRVQFDLPDAPDVKKRKENS